MKTLRKILLCSLLCTIFISCSHDTPHLTDEEVKKAMAAYDQLIKDGLLFFTDVSEAGNTSFAEYISNGSNFESIKNYPALKERITSIEETPAPQGSIIISKVYDNIYNDITFDEHKTCVYSNISFDYTYNNGEEASFYLNGQYTESTAFSNNNSYVSYKIENMNINGKKYKPLTIAYIYKSINNETEHKLIYYITELVFNGKPATAAQLRKLNSSLGYI